MSAFQELNGYYQEWRQLSEQEGSAIRSSDWPKVRGCQEAKFCLQAQIMIATQLFQKELTDQGMDAKEYDRQFRGIVAELILLEERNGSWLNEQKTRALEERDELAKSSSNLRQVRSAYVQGNKTHWNSYS